MLTCENDTCNRPAKTRRLCHTHYEAARLRGGLVVRERDPVKRFWSRVKRTEGCWEWTGATASGYGRVAWGRVVRPAHRISYQLEVGPIPDGLDLDHLCRNRRCVRPDHLEPVTRQVNLLRGVGVPAVKARRTHCEHGHEFTPENTYLWRGSRCCRTCRAAVQAARPRPAYLNVTATCVMCGSVFSYERGPGGRPRNVCSDDCRLARDRRKARDHARRKRAAIRSS